MSNISVVFVLISGIIGVGIVCAGLGFGFGIWRIRHVHIDDDGPTISSGLRKPTLIVLAIIEALLIWGLIRQLLSQGVANEMRSFLLSLPMFPGERGSWRGLGILSYPNCVDFFIGAILGAWLGWTAGMSLACKAIPRSQGIGFVNCLRLFSR